MGLIDEMQELILRDVMQKRQEGYVAALRERLTTEKLNDEALASLELMFCTGWMECIQVMKELRGGR